jgi:hypothetical protein
VIKAPKGEKEREREVFMSFFQIIGFRASLSYKVERERERERERVIQMGFVVGFIEFELRDSFKMG